MFVAAIEAIAEPVEGDTMPLLITAGTRVIAYWRLLVDKKVAV